MTVGRKPRRRGRPFRSPMAALAMIAAIVLGGSMFGAVAANADPPPPLLNTAAPVVTGAPEPGVTLSLTTTGVWSNTIATVTYQWYRYDDDGSNPVGPPGDTSYTMPDGSGEEFFLDERVTDIFGQTGEVVSNYIGPVYARVALDVAIPPTISGTARPGETLTVTPAVWILPTNPSTFQWHRETSTGTVDVSVDGADQTSYVVQPSDVGGRLYVTESASSPDPDASPNTASRDSALTAVVAAAAPPAAPTTAPTTPAVSTNTGAGDTLADTGSAIAPPLVAGGLLLLLGAGTLIASVFRRRRSESAIQ